MSRRRGQLKLGAFLMTTGHHVAAWRHPAAQADLTVGFRHYAEIARAAERAKFDLMFLADHVSVTDYGPEAMSRTARADLLDPIVLLSGIAAVTERLGLVATVSSSYNEPYNLARKFASLDVISGGRAGWNLVTSATDAEARNFNLEGQVAHADRYGRAREFADVVKGLWESWEDDAFLRDKASGVFFDPRKLHRLDHRGGHFQVRGPLNVPRSPQGHPVVVQAGSSEDGKALAAESAEVIFTAQTTIDDARTFYADVKGRMAAFGRDPDHLKVMPGLFPVLGRSRAEAEDKFAEIQDLVHPAVGLELLSKMLGGADLSAQDLDGPLPENLETNGGKSRLALLVDLARRESLSIRGLYLRIAGGRGHWTLRGTAADIADEIEAWFLGHGADGFNIMPPTLPGGLTDVVDLLLPELRRRGLFRHDYEGRTLRENLGLPFPHHPRAARPDDAALPSTQGRLQAAE